MLMCVVPRTLGGVASYFLLWYAGCELRAAGAESGGAEHTPSII